jgi:hypothetical protein
MDEVSSTWMKTEKKKEKEKEIYLNKPQAKIKK